MFELVIFLFVVSVIVYVVYHITSSDGVEAQLCQQENIKLISESLVCADSVDVWSDK